MSIATPERLDVDQHFPTDDEYLRHLAKRTRRGTGAKLTFMALLTVAVLGLVILLYTIIDDSFGLVAIVNENNPEDVVAAAGFDPDTTGLGDLDKEQLVELLQGSVSNGVGRRLERDQRFFEDRLVFESQAKWDEVCASGDAPAGCTGGARDQGNVLRLVEERVVQPDIIAANGMTASVLDREGFEETIAQEFIDTPEKYPDYTFDQVRFEWRAWVSWKFITPPPRSIPGMPGPSTAILGSPWLGLLSLFHISQPPRPY